MPELTVTVGGATLVPVGDEPTCCPDAYLCLTGEEPEIECPRHGGFDVCCSRPDLHVSQDRAAWHRQMDRWEQRLLDETVRAKTLPELLAIVGLPVPSSLTNA